MKSFLNHVLGREPGPLSGRERAVRRLRAAQGTVEVLSGKDLTITNFVFDFDPTGKMATLEYFCSTCGSHVLAHHVKVLGIVACPCGILTGKEI
jgi:ribosomal protein S27AE